MPAKMSAGYGIRFEEYYCHTLSFTGDMEPSQVSKAILGMTYSDQVSTFTL